MAVGTSARWAERGTALVFQAMALLAPVLGMAAPLGEAPLVTIGGAAVLFLTLVGRQGVRLRSGYVVLFAALACLGMLSCLWTIDLAMTASRGSRLIGEIAIGLVLVDAAGRIDEGAQRRIIVSMLIGMAIAGAIAVLDLILNHSVIAMLRPSRPIATEFDRGATTLVVLLWPALIHLGMARRYFLLGLVLVGVAVVVTILLSDSAKLALVIGIMAAVLVNGLGDRLTRSLAYVLPLGILVMPLIALSLPSPEALIHDRPIAKVSALHRLVIWQFTGQRIAERPWLGWGLDTSRDLPGGDHSYAIEDRPDAPPMVALSLHPHNGALQLWVELGLGGAAVGAALLFLLCRDGAVLTGIPRAGFYGGLFSTLTIAMLSYGVWQSWWNEELWLFAALMRLVLNAPARQQAPG